jgi:HSP20 family protein
MFGELMRWNPAEELSSWHCDIDHLFGRFFGRAESSMGSWVPRIETYRKDNDYVVHLDLPGVDPKDVQVHSEGNILSIVGERKTEHKESGYRGTFERTVTLPKGVESEKIAARYEHGVLEIRVPLPAQLAGRPVPIQIEQNGQQKLEPKPRNLRRLLKSPICRRFIRGVPNKDPFFVTFDGCFYRL